VCISRLNFLFAYPILICSSVISEIDKLNEQYDEIKDVFLIVFRREIVETIAETVLMQAWT